MYMMFLKEYRQSVFERCSMCVSTKMIFLIYKPITLVLGLFSVLFIKNGSPYMVGNNPDRRAAYLDDQKTYHLEWHVDRNKNEIHFNLTVRSTGYILFGLANNDNPSTGADLLVAGVNEYGRPYIFDGYTTNLGDISFIQDDQQDYKLLSFWESRTTTFLSFSRALDTCDSHDYPITENRVIVAWGYGANDYRVGKLGQLRNSGSFETYLLDPEYNPRIVRGDDGTPKVLTRENLSTWTIKRRLRIPDNSTSYLCSIHKGPSLLRKHHVVGYDIHFPDKISQQRTHHLLVYKCSIPPGVGDTTTTFEPFVNSPAEPCYFPQIPSSERRIPTHFCAEFYIAWAIGGGSYFNPPHVGYPLGTSPDEYYMVQVHYDNPQQSTNTLVDLRLDFFYTSNLRDNEGGFMGVGHEVPGLPPSLLIPPYSRNHRLFTHCSPECTDKMFPSNGIKIVGLFLHAHTSGKRLRLRHFRKGRELEWVMFDDNYGNQFQPIRHLRKERRVLPGDQLTMECSYDNTWTNGTVIGGFTTRQEMCMAFVTYYERIEFSYCRSEIMSEDWRHYFLGVRNVTWNENILDWEVTVPRSLAGLTVSEISDNYVVWDGVRREMLQRFHEVHPHVGKCSRTLSARDGRAVQALLSGGGGSGGGGLLTGDAPQNVDTVDDYSGVVSYPFKATPYVPRKSCSYA